MSLGDASSLSFTDTNLIALAYTMIEANGKLDQLHKQPPKPLQFRKVKKEEKDDPHHQ